MKCPQCQHENPIGAKFCEECAAPLARRCTSCGGLVSYTAKFCTECGHPLAPVSDRFTSPEKGTPWPSGDKVHPPPAVPEGERKQVTVLFADIKGSMELFAERDAEAADKFLIGPVLDRMIEAVRRYQGTVHRIMGDGIMALFGAPLALEDHAVRACYAALGMQETVARYADKVWHSHGARLAIRVGLNSGEIVIRVTADDQRPDYAIVGQTANLASRMEQMAIPGSVLTTADTFRLAEGYVAMKPLGPVPVKGLAEPVEVYEVTGPGAAQTRLQAAAGRGLTRFVGRDIELEQLVRAGQLAGDGRGQVMAIAGEAGVGKSRLLREFLDPYPAADWLVLQCRCVFYGHTRPYLPVIELLRYYFGINVHDSTLTIREKVLSKVLALDHSLQDAVPPVLDLLDALDDEHPFRSLDPPEHRQHTYQAVTRLLLHESRVQPVIMVVEDMHWTDTLTLGLLNDLLVGAQNASLLLVVSYRPEYRDEWRNRPNYHQLRLDPLAGESLAELFQALLGSDPSLITVKRFLAERASGNPFFVEEIVRALVDTGVLDGVRGSYRLARPFSSIDVPPTVRTVLAARIDALPAAEKRLLQEAAVIGYDAPFALLRAICGLNEDTLRDLLSNLQANEFLYATQFFPELQYTFKHALTHDVTYSGMLHERRQDIHARIVDAIERLHGARLGEQVDRLAYHALQGRLQDKAVDYLRQAGKRAAAQAALADAQGWFEHALDVLRDLPETQTALAQAFEIRLELRPVLRQLGEGRKMLEYLREAEALAERLQDDRRLGQVCAFITTVQSTLDELDEALIAGARALQIAEQIGDLKLRIVATSHLEQAHYYRGEYERVVELAPDNLAILPADWHGEYFGMAFPPSVAGRAFLIMSLAELGSFAEAARYEAEATRLAAATQHAFTIGWADFAASMLHLLKGDWANAHSRLEHWIGMLRSGRVAIHLPWAVAASAWAMAQIGKTGEALDRVQEGEQLLEQQAARGIVAYRPWAYGAVSRACLQLGRLDEARRLGGRALETSERHPGFAAHAHHLLGDIASHPGGFDAETAAAHYREAMALAGHYRMRPLAAHCRLGFGRLYSRSGEMEEAHANIAAATAMYREMEMSFWLAQAADLMKRAGTEPRVQPASEPSPSNSRARPQFPQVRSHAGRRHC